MNSAVGVAPSAPFAAPHDLSSDPAERGDADLRELLRLCQSAEPVLPRVLPWLRDRGGYAAVIWQPIDGSPPSVTCDPHYGRERLTADFPLIKRAAEQARAARETVITSLGGSHHLVTLPALLHGACWGTLHAMVPRDHTRSTDGTDLPPTTCGALALAAPCLAGWMAATGQHPSADLPATKPSGRSLEHVVPDWEQPQHTYYRIAEAVRPLVGATYLALAVCPLGKQLPRVRAVAGVDNFDRDSEFVRTVEAVLREVSSPPTATTLVFQRQDRHLSVPQRRMLELLQAEQCQIQFLRQGETTLGAWVLLRDWDDPTAEPTMDPCLLAQSAAWIDMFRHGEPTRAALAWQGLRKSMHGGLLAVGACLLLLLLALPIRYRIHVPCVVEPVTRRFITVPYEGRLQTALVQPGDMVEAQQVVALMDGHEIELQLSSVTADLQRAKKQRDASLATHDTSMAQIAALEVERLELQCQLLADRVKHLEIRSPVAGVVISGDPRKTEGARFTMGQTILEIGPLDNMVLELEVPPDEISHIRLGNSTSFRLESLPYQRFQGTLNQVHPRAETRENQHVFLAEMQLQPGQAGFLPGMRGWARIDSDRRQLGWIVFHRLYEQALFWLGW